MDKKPLTNAIVVGTTIWVLILSSWSMDSFESPFISLEE
jgi:hypothetical protein